MLSTLQTHLAVILAMMDSKRAKSGQGALAAIIGLGSVAIALMLIIIIVGSVEANAPALTGIANTTFESAATQIFNALNLAPIVLIVIVAGIVIGILVVFSRG